MSKYTQRGHNLSFYCMIYGLRLRQTPKKILELALLVLRFFYSPSLSRLISHTLKPQIMTASSIINPT